MASLKKWLKHPKRALADTLSRTAMANLAKAARKSGPMVSRSNGLMVMKDHYYSPIPSETDLSAPDYFDRMRDLPGVDIDDSAILDFIATDLPPALESFRAWLSSEAGKPEGFRLVNGAYMAVDAHLYFATVLLNRPRRIIEIGCGRSTDVAVAARAALRDATGQEVEHLCVEPYPNDKVRALADSGAIELLESRVQDVPLDRFLALGEGDILFIDSTHVLREGSDVQFEFLEVLPRLGSGVSVHVHDVSLPKPYPRTYVDQGLFWNEQYLLQAYLINNARIRVTWPGNYMMCRHPDAMMSAFPEIADMRATYPMSEPTAFWFRTV